ncbi:MAG: glycosyltransferase family 4 protein [Candidatus Eisenbacteria bacterium]|uniref:Glycosyltransferase family 4 protein n=1 Tax=Eiseniibacteriota bacterium TaxID=2212470 RepID=A0A933SGB1_UNCEI|nr:glycosyltransferase family 4 protein [Candidatus Eisenbacteria bacterium]
MRIATFLPHVGVFGGVRRFLELGNEWVARGHDVTLYHPEGNAPAWLPYRGRVVPLTAAADAESDVAVCADPHTYGTFRAHRSGRHVYYCVIEGDAGLDRALPDHGVTLAANSGALRAKLARRAGRPVLDGVGGIRTSVFRPLPALRAGTPLRVLVNGRRSRPKKGTDLVLRVLAGLVGKVPEFEVVLFDSVDVHNRQDPRDGAPLPPNARFVIGPTQEELVALYQSSHVFVAAERKAGWCNTALEALASGCAVVCTRSGTRDFAVHEHNALVAWRHPFFLRRAIRRVLTDGALRERLAAAGPASAEPWGWPVLAEKLLRQF